MDELWGNLQAAGLTAAASAAGGYWLLNRNTETPTTSTAVAAEASVAEIRVACGALVDSVTFVFTDGNQKRYGGHGGTQQAPFVLQPDECGNAKLVDSTHFILSTHLKNITPSHEDCRCGLLRDIVLSQWLLWSADKDSIWIRSSF